MKKLTEAPHIAGLEQDKILTDWIKDVSQFCGVMPMWWILFSVYLVALEVANSLTCSFNRNGRKKA